MVFNRVGIFIFCGYFNCGPDFTDRHETVAASGSLHGVAQYPDFSKISRLECFFNGGYIFRTVFQVAGYQVAKVRVNMGDDFFLSS